MKKLNSLLFVYLLVMFSCKPDHKQVSDHTNRNPNPQPFFIGDEVIHYTCTEPQALHKQVTTNIHVQSLYIGDFPDTLNNPCFEEELNKYFKGKKLEEKKIELLHQVLSNSKTAQGYNDMYAACMPEYNDILVFKEDNKITGIAKLCFQCGQAHLIGNRHDDQFFGSHSDLIDLKQILNSK